MKKGKYYEIPTTGWFGSPGRKHKYYVPEAPKGITSVEQLIPNPFRTEPPRALKSLLVQLLRYVTDLGFAFGDYTAEQYAAAKDFIRPTELVCEGPLMARTKFKLTSLGREFLASYEAPESW